MCYGAITIRAWDKKQKQMFWWDVLWGNHYQGDGYIGMVPWGEKQTHHMHRDNMRLVDPDDCEIMQFTGLHDKNGKEIYEGDIVRKDGWIYEIRWSKYGAGFDLATKNDSWPKQEDGYAYHSGLYDTEIIEVIGNVYENPELLKGK